MSVAEWQQMNAGVCPNKSSTNIPWIRNCGAYSEQLTLCTWQASRQPTYASAYEAASGRRTSRPPSWKYHVTLKIPLWPSMHIYKNNNHAKFHPNPTSNDQAVGLFEECCPKKHKHKKKNNKSCDMRSVSYPTRIRSMERGICPIAAVCTVVEI